MSYFLLFEAFLSENQYKGMRHKKAKLQQQASLLEMFDFRLFVPICVHTCDMTV